MAKLHYRIVEHDGGWAYRLGDVYSERFPRRDDAIAAARRVVAEQRVPGEPTLIEYEDENGRWHTERSDGNDHPDADVIV
ncbi:MAG TPA: DUF2188 domain-containing protein [Rhodopila sp.]|nr:DUF2188 domain-containing protein [Rhodopila sp.]